ncbi:MAG: hypothetical protein VX375_05160 [Pseudomonadota bacterium]
MYFEKVLAFHAVFRREFPITGPMLWLTMVAVGESLQIELRQIVVQAREFLLQAYVSFMQANEYQPMPSIQGKLWQAVALPVYLNVTAVWQTDQDALVVVSPGMIGAYDAVADVTEAIIQ